MIRLLFVPIVCVALLVALVLILVDRSDDTPTVRVVTTSGAEGWPGDAWTGFTVPETTTTTRPKPKVVLVPNARTAPISGDVWHALATCETGGKMDNPNTGNGYYGYFQFDRGTWQDEMGMPGLPHHFSYEEQKAVAQRLQARAGWGRWPHCARKLGLLRGEA